MLLHDLPHVRWADRVGGGTLLDLDRELGRSAHHRPPFSSRCLPRETLDGTSPRGSRARAKTDKRGQHRRGIVGGETGRTPGCVNHTARPRKFLANSAPKVAPRHPAAEMSQGDKNKGVKTSAKDRRNVSELTRVRRRLPGDCKNRRPALSTADVHDELFQRGRRVRGVRVGGAFSYLTS